MTQAQKRTTKPQFMNCKGKNILSFILRLKK